MVAIDIPQNQAVGKLRFFISFVKTNTIPTAEINGIALNNDSVYWRFIKDAIDGKIENTQ